MKHLSRKNKNWNVGTSSQQAGFTLMETIIYSALLALFLTATFLFTNSILSTSSDIIERNELVANKEFLDKKLNWIISQGTSITVPAAGGTIGSLTVNGPTPALSPAVFSLSSGRIMLSVAGGAASAITNNRVTVTSFSVTHVFTAANIQEARITVSMQSVAKPKIVSTGEIFTYDLP